MSGKTKAELVRALLDAEQERQEWQADRRNLKKIIDRQNRRLAGERDKKADLRAAMYEAVEANLATLEVKPVKPPKLKATKGSPEVAIPFVSDLQLAKKTQGYNSDIAAERMAWYGDKIEAITAVQRSAHPVDECNVFMIGDIVEGELIFPGQSHEIDSSLYTQVMVDGPAIMSDFLRRLLSVFKKVKVYAVIGNHGAFGGRSRRDMHPESNADRFLYTMLETMFKDEPRIEFVIPQRDWYVIADLGEKLRFMLFHGDQIRGHSGFPWYGFGKKLLGWKALASNNLMEDFDHAAAGHWHTPTTMYINDVRCWVNGSTESHNAYAQEQLASMGRPCQWLLFGQPGFGVTAEYLVNLEGEEAIAPATAQ